MNQLWHRATGFASLCKLGLRSNACFFTAFLLASMAAVQAAESGAVKMAVHDLTPLHDSARVLVNPHKGWYHHFPDNHPNKYQIARDADLLEFPGMDHLYIRLAWSYLEPREGQFDWAVIDRIIEKWTANGLGIAFRITCKETGTDRIEQQFATPRWVMEAGAKGGHYQMGRETGPEGPWEPVFDDPIFLAKLDRFLEAFAARYDQKPWVRYVDVGSIGDWGEGHSWAGSRKDCGFAARKQHLDIYLKHFKHAPLIVSDDFVYALGNPDERKALHQYVLKNGIGYRDDSIMVNGYFEGTSDQFTVRSPGFFADAYEHTLNVFELEHYGIVKKMGNWEGRPDSSVARFGKGKKGPDFFRGALELLHASYIGYHGDAHEWLTDNRELTGELLNRCGYWLFPKSIELPQTLVAGATAPFTLTMENRGVAPPYAPYELRVKLSGSSGRVVRVLATGCKSWLPGSPVPSKYDVAWPSDLKPDEYALAIGLFDLSTGKERPVDFALKASTRDAEGYYRLINVSVEAPRKEARAATPAAVITVSAPETPMLQFAMRKLESAMLSAGHPLKRVPNLPTGPAPALQVTIDPSSADRLGDDGFRLLRTRDGHTLIAGGERGAMYGMLDVAEQIRLGTSLNQIQDRTVKVQFPFRAIKFNLPWAAYRTSLAIEQHQATCRDLKFWEAFLDMMAENRFNVLSLWSLHPFHYMVRPKNFPEACPFSDAELAEWRLLWSGIFAMAKERGIETCLLNWNIFVPPEFARAHNVARWSENWSYYGQESATNDIVVRYTKEVVTQVLDEYPDLTGLGITLGERMGGLTPDQRRAWLDQTFFAGIADAQRPVKFIYRAPLSANTGSGGTTSEENDRRTRAQIEGLSRNITGPVYVEFKHNWSHALSSPDLFIVHGGKLSDAYWNPPPTRHKVVWTMRNEDMFILRWGQPDFVRDFLKNQSADYVGGAVIGSECYVPALDYITAPGPHKTWRYAFERQWLFYATWGRLLYDGTTPDRVFASLLEERFGKGVGSELLEAWKLASNVPLHFASFHQGTWDGSLYTEGFSSWVDNGPRTFFDIDAFIKHPVLDRKRYVNIADFVKTGSTVEPGKLSPPALAAQLDQDCTTALKRIASVRARARPSPTLECELTDIEAWCAYGAYFAEKLRGGVALAQARAAKDTRKQQEAVAALEKALEHWQRLAGLGARFNQLPVPSNSKEPFSWAQLTPAVQRDIATARAGL